MILNMFIALTEVGEDDPQGTNSGVNQKCLPFIPYGVNFSSHIMPEIFYWIFVFFLFLVLGVKGKIMATR